MRPFLCVGLAYFVIAVMVPLVLLGTQGENGQWTVTGTIWSLAAGAAGAIGALGIIMAFNFGGKPIYVMPLVFGGAPVVNTFTTIVSEGTFRQVTTAFYASLLLVIAGAVTVLIFAPKPARKPSAEGSDVPLAASQRKQEPPLQPAKTTVPVDEAGQAPAEP